MLLASSLAVVSWIKENEFGRGLFHFFFVNFDYNLIYLVDEFGLFFLQLSTSEIHHGFL